MTLEEARRELGVSTKASDSAVRKAFKRLALRHHPDHNKGDAGAAERFGRIWLAYEILSGARSATPSASPDPPEPAASGVESSPEPLPQTWAGGEPIYYPTTEEIAALDRPRVGGSKVTAMVLLLGGFALLGLLAFLMAMSGKSADDLLHRNPPPVQHPSYPVRR